MNEENILYTLALQSIKGIGPQIGKQLIEKFGDAKSVFKESYDSLLEISRVNPKIIKILQSSEPLSEAEKELEFIVKNEIQVFDYFDKSYPTLLKECNDAPLLLFGRGNLDLNISKNVSIVGTRNMTSYGKTFIEKFIQELSVYKPLIVSGFAFGIDITAHLSAINNKLPTVAVLAHGFKYLYPASHQIYGKQILENGGFITEFWSNTNPQKEHFLKRNRIIAGLTNASIIIESGFKGGAISTAHLANSYHRDVYALPGRVDAQYSQGCNELIRKNIACILNSANEFIKAENWHSKEIEKVKTEKKLPKEISLDNLNENEKIILKQFTENHIWSIDELALKINSPVQKISQILFELEIKEKIKPIPGKKYEIIY